jgi:hypothetical protein
MKMILAKVFTLSVMVVLATSLKYDVKAIQRDNLYTDKLENSSMKVYAVEIDSQLQDRDLLIDTSMQNSNGIYETPITLVSLVNILS